MHFSGTRPTQLRVLIYSQDGFGLGHMRRTHLIATRLLDMRAEASVLTLSDSPLRTFFKSSPDHHYMKLPTITKIAPGAWRPARPELELPSVLSIRTERIWTAVTTFRPHLLLVDHMPQGAMGELLPALQHLEEQDSSTRVVVGLRDILDAPDVVCENWTQEGVYQAIERYYDLVLVYGQHEVFDLTTMYQLPLAVRERLHYCGYVCSPPSSCGAARVRAACLARADAGTKIILGLAGGGADGYSLMSALLDALPIIVAHQPTAAVLITGPFLPADLRRRLQAQAHNLPARVLAAASDARSYIEAADVVVSMAGYNTTVEILRSGTPGILIPRAGPSAEQRIRAELFTARGWAEMIDPVEVSGERVADAVIEALTRGRHCHPQGRPNLQGLSASVDHLLSLFASP